MMQNDKGDGRNIHYSGAFDDETGAMRASRLMWSEHVTRLASENLVLKRDLAAAQAVLPCGHHHSLMLKSAETGESLYCELCDMQSQRNDFETELNETKSFVAALKGLHAGDVETLKAEQDALREKANALLHQIDIGDYVDSEGHVLKNNIAVLILMKALTNA